MTVARRPVSEELIHAPHLIHCEVNLPMCRAAVEFDGLGVSAIVLRREEVWLGEAGGVVELFNLLWEQSQIEVTFEIGSNDFERGSGRHGIGKSEKITFTNDKGRLSEEQIAKMFFPRQFVDDDKMAKERVDAKNAFVGLHATRGAAEESGDDNGLSEKLHEGEKNRSCIPSRMASCVWILL